MSWFCLGTSRQTMTARVSSECKNDHGEHIQACASISFRSHFAATSSHLKLQPRVSVASDPKPRDASSTSFHAASFKKKLRDTALLQASGAQLVERDHGDVRELFPGLALLFTVVQRVRCNRGHLLVRNAVPSSCERDGHRRGSSVVRFGGTSLRSWRRNRLYDSVNHPTMRLTWLQRWWRLRT